MSSKQSPVPPDTCPVGVIMERRLARVGRWEQYQWECLAVVAGKGVAPSQNAVTCVSEDGERARFLFSGLQLAMHRDGCESYWYNLQSERPYLFVICFQDEMTQDEAMAVEPVLVTASQDEANAHMESEDLVFSVPMPDTVVQWLEAYVVEHYEPYVKKKRKRRDWAREDENHAKARRVDRRFH
jgi:hypothetical protein